MKTACVEVSPLRKGAQRLPRSHWLFSRAWAQKHSLCFLVPLPLDLAVFFARSSEHGTGSLPQCISGWILADLYSGMLRRLFTAAPGIVYSESLLVLAFHMLSAKKAGSVYFNGNVTTADGLFGKAL